MCIFRSFSIRSHRSIPYDCFFSETDKLGRIQQNTRIRAITLNCRCPYDGPTPLHENNAGPAYLPNGIGPNARTWSWRLVQDTAKVNRGFSPWAVRGNRQCAIPFGPTANGRWDRIKVIRIGESNRVCRFLRIRLTLVSPRVVESPMGLWLILINQ